MSMVKWHLSGITLCCVPACMTVVVAFTGPSSSDTFSNLYFLSQLISSIAIYIAFIPSFLAACPDNPSAVASITISPFSAIAGCIPVGSPTIAKSILGNSGITLSIPFFPDTSSSADARKTRLSFLSLSMRNVCKSATNPPPQSFAPSP